MSYCKHWISIYSLKPRVLKAAIDNEPWTHKARIVGFSILMASVATYYQYYFDMLVYRSGQFQNAALAGETGFDFMDYKDNAWWGGDRWTSH